MEASSSLPIYHWARSLGTLPGSAQVQGTQVWIAVVNEAINMTFICNPTNTMGTGQGEVTIVLRDISGWDQCSQLCSMTLPSLKTWVPGCFPQGLMLTALACLAGGAWGGRDRTVGYGQAPGSRAGFLSPLGSSHRRHDRRTGTLGVANGRHMGPLVSPQGHLANSLFLSASVLVLWLPQCSQASLSIQKIPEMPQKNQDLLLSLHGVPSTFQDVTWYLGETTDGGTRLFTYIPELLRPQRDGEAMGQRDMVGFPNGSLLLRHAQPGDSGLYQVALAVNAAWTMRAKAHVQVVEGTHTEPTTAHVPMNAGVVAAAIVGPLAVASLLIGGLAYLLVTRSWGGQSSRMPAREKPELRPSRDTGDSNVYEVMPSPVLLLTPATPPLPEPQPQPEPQHYQDLLNPDPAPYCQLAPTA
ncbi:PREDICTED: carcinoembryonic antigen-related cell adhesion molecule 19 [Dipodomys ordii]|uniref:Carcinoembryonic antigen-related cell adhesion molecule 19 n=1 Tax=Dipodomys ordii TaxID=10020 RepID=A0A1S3GH69_DIPOR|nr:PREDICTED: carcinoembryonic antigen-related cell adhesion molecule 19 [Dipodomys ordii]